MAKLAWKVFTSARKSYLQWGSTWKSLDQNSQAYPIELDWYILVRLRIIRPNKKVTLYCFLVYHLSLKAFKICLKVP